MKFFHSFTPQSVRQGAIALALVAASLSACDYNNQPTAVNEPVLDEPAATEEVVERQEEYNVDLGELTGNVEDYLGRTVSVRGDAESAIGETAFLLQDDQLFGGQEVVVFNATGQPFVIPQDEPTDQFQVTGEVQQLVIADLEQAYGLDLDPNLFVDYENRPAIIAQSIAIAPDPGEIAAEPTAYYNQVIAVEGEVEERLGANVFSIDNENLFGTEDLLVIASSAGPVIEDDEEIVATGTLRPFVVADFERDYDFEWDEGFVQQLEAEYSNRPVLVADQVYPSAE